MSPPSPTSAIPNFYYAIFAFYEPALPMIGLVQVLRDPQRVHNAQAPWPADSLPPASLPKASVVAILQLARVCALMGLLNVFFLTAARKHLAAQRALQEKIVRALMLPLLVGDVMHISVTLWALGDGRWDVARWSPLLSATIVIGFSLLVPRVMWHLGVWRYVDARNGTGALLPGSQTEK